MGKVKKGPKKGMSDARKKSAPQKALNPFEIHVNRQKFQVLGRKSKTDRGLPGVARAKALKKRKATLLQEFKLKDKSNKFFDRRIGERNSAMTAEDKMTARFTAERMRAQSRKTMFNLADEEVLTHRGQTLNEIEKFDDPRSDEEDDEDNPLQLKKGNLDADFVGDAHFGGGLLSRSHEDGAKSRKDLIDQLITESKKRKVEQQKLREQTLDLTDKLDTEWKDLLPVISAGPKASDVEKPKPDSYDTLMRELKFEARGKPSDRLKSEDEVAREEKEKLEELEAARVRRMQGITDSSNAEPNHRSADDLDDGFAMDTDEEDTDEKNTSGRKMEDDSDHESGSEEIVADEENHMDDKNDDEADTEDGESSEESDEDNIDDLKFDSSGEESSPESENNEEETRSESEMEATSLKAGSTVCESSGEESSHESENTEEETKSGSEIEAASLKEKRSVGPFILSKVAVDQVSKAEAIREDLRKRKELMEAARKELPYTFEVPSTYEELQIVLAGRSPEHQGVIVERMVKCTHPSLANGNKEKLSSLFSLLMQHLHDAGAADEDENVCWSILDRLAPSLFDIAQWCPNDAAECVRHVLQEKQKEFRNCRKKFPGAETLIFFKLVSLLFPTSDFRHPVVTPALIFMGQILSTCSITSRQDVARGLLVVSFFLEYTVLSKRLSPESINFLRNILYLSSTFPSQANVVRGSMLTVRPMLPLKRRNLLCLSLRPKSIVRNNQPNDYLSASDLNSSKAVDDLFCITSLLVSLRILASFVTQLSPQPACRHIFNPFTPLLQNLLEGGILPCTMEDEIQTLQKLIQSINEASLKYLVAAPKRPKMLKLYEPNIQHVYTDGRQHRPISKEKQESEKLLHRYKREKKGALREIRKDRDFLAKIRIKQQLKSDAERRAKVREIYGEASMQQGEMRKLAKEKKK